MDSCYTIYCTSDEIDSNDAKFLDRLKSILKNPDSRDLLSGTSPRISIAVELLQPAVEVVSLRRLVRCEYDGYKQDELYRVDTQTKLDYAFYEATDISTEQIDGNIRTRNIIEFRAANLQISKKCESYLKQLFIFAENFFE